MQIGLVGCNHRTAPVEFRERLAFRREELPGALAALRAAGPYAEAALLSTCNRVELVVAAEELGRFPEAALAWLAAARGVEPEELRRSSYAETGFAAARHLFAVAASLDSLVPGEPEILAQVREAFAAARAAGTVGAHLTVLFERAFRAAKAIRTATAIGRGKVSVGSAAVELAGKIFGDFDTKHVVLFGTGEMGVRILEGLAAAGARRITVVSRDAERARTLAARFGAAAADYAARDELLATARIVLTAADAPRAFLRPEEVGELLRRRSAPLCIIDVAVPRNVDPRLAEIPQLYLYNIDDLEAVIGRALRARSAATVEAEPLLARELDALAGDWAARAADDVIRALREHFHARREEELAEHAGWLADLSPEARERVGRLARHLVDRLLHEPCAELELAAREETSGPLAALVASRLFRLELAAGAAGAKAPSPPRAPEPPAPEPPAPPPAAPGA